MLIIVKGTIRQIVFIIERKPIRLEISKPNIKINNMKIVGESLK